MPAVSTLQLWQSMKFWSRPHRQRQGNGASPNPNFKAFYSRAKAVECGVAKFDTLTHHLGCRQVVVGFWWYLGCRSKFEVY